MHLGVSRDTLSQRYIKEIELRAVILATGCAIALAAGAAQATPSPHAAVIVHPDQVQLIGEVCGPGRHWAHGWRDRYGNWHRAHCVPN
jgi:hypothetical protein